MLCAVHTVIRASHRSPVVVTLGMLAGIATLVANCKVTKPQNSTTRSASPARSAVHFVGRVASDPAGSAQYAWSGAGIVARFHGTGVIVRLGDDKNEHLVTLDGQTLPKIVTLKGTERYVIAENLSLGEHQLELYRRTEALFGVTHFLGLDIIGGELIGAANSPTRHFELVGDSISCGYGNEGKGPACSFSAATENHYLSYGAVLARTLGAELSTVAWSGRGVVKNYNGEPGEKMGVLYDRILPESSSSHWQQRRSNDAVIVNLGTNDLSTDPDPSEAEFVQGYLSLLEQIRHNNPNAFILCTLGPMLGGEDLHRGESYIEKALDRRRRAGDARIAAHRMRTQNENPGCDWHPSVSTHQRMADELAPVIRTALGW